MHTHTHTHTLHTEVSAIESTTRLRLNATILPEIKAQTQLYVWLSGTLAQSQLQIELLCRPTHTHTRLHSTRQLSHRYTQFRNRRARVNLEAWISQVSSMSLNTEGQCKTTVKKKRKKKETPPPQLRKLTLAPPLPCIHIQIDAHRERKSKHKSCKRQVFFFLTNYPHRKRVKTRMRNEGIKRWREEEDVPWSHLLDYG